VRIGKGEHAFCYPEHIPAQMDALFASIHGGDVFVDRSRQEFAGELTRLLMELNAIHPFREGNGRTQLSFAGLIGATFDHPLAFERLDRATFLPAMVESFSGKQAALRMEIDKLLL
jgi:cell filamentation protein